MALENLKCPGLEQTLAVYPEIMPCPLCGTEIEIWSDEKKGKCASCNKLVDPRQPVKKQLQVAVKEYIKSSGETLWYERYKATIPIPAIDQDKKYRVACEACHKFGKNLACPPYSPVFNEYIGTQTHAGIICIRMPQEYFKHAIQENNYRQCFRTARSILVDELLGYRSRGYLIAGSGFCLACEVCAVEEGLDSCRKPDNRIYSLESLGVNLTALTKLCFHFDLEWSANDASSDFVCSIGAVFLHENDEME